VRNQTQGFADGEVRRNLALLGPHIRRTVMRRQAVLRYRAVAALGLCEASIRAPVVVPAIVELYNLTPREMTVLATLIENAGVPEIADILGLSDGIVKTHLASIFRKTGAARQSDLIKMVAGASSPFQ
jgi:DNA-binding CsgD family transcriptional regulator